MKSLYRVFKTMDVVLTKGLFLCYVPNGKTFAHNKLAARNEKRI